MDVMKTLRELQDLVNEIGYLQMKKSLLEKQVKEKKTLLKEECEKHGVNLIQEEECNKCKGTGEYDDKTCTLCEGDCIRYYITVPTEPDDDFVCRIFDVSQLVANQKKARKILNYQTFDAIFKPVLSIRCNVNPTKDAKARIGQ